MSFLVARKFNLNLGKENLPSLQEFYKKNEPINEKEITRILHKSTTYHKYKAVQVRFYFNLCLHKNLSSAKISTPTIPL